MVSHPPISVADLAEVVERLKVNDGDGFSREFESIEPGQQFTWDVSSKDVNKGKNRYANVITYDHSRVILQMLDDIPGSDYINANYMDGYCKHNAYIATQVISRSLSIQAAHRSFVHLHMHLRIHFHLHIHLHMHIHLHIYSFAY